MHRVQTYLPQDRLRALAENRSLPDRTYGSAILADISGFTHLTEKLTRSLGARKGADNLSRQLNAVYSALIERVEQYGGSIISFAGDAIIGWFEPEGDSSSALRAVTCATVMQAEMEAFTDLSLKIAIATGPARRFVVGEPDIQLLDTLAGKTIMRLASAERLAGKGEIVLDQATGEAIAPNTAMGEPRVDAPTSEQFLVLKRLVHPAAPQPSPALDEAALLAFHYSRTENTAKKREYLKKAGEAAQGAYANESALDYYRQVSNNSPRPEERIDLLLRMGTVLQLTGQWEQAKAQYETALQVAEQHGLEAQRVSCQVKLATWHSLRGNYPSAREQLEKAFQLAEQSGDRAGTCDVFIELSNVYWRLGNFETALGHARQGVELARQMGDMKRESEALFFMGTISGQQANYAESKVYFEKTLALASKLNDKRRVASVLMNHSTNYYYQGDYQTARDFMENGLATYREIGDKRGTTLALNNLANLFYMEADYVTARRYYQQALALARETGDRYALSLALSSLGITAFQQGEYAQADVYYQESLSINTQLGDKIGLSLVQCYLGLLALNQGQSAQAYEFFLAGLQIAQQSEIHLYFIYNLIGIACVLVAEEQPGEAAKLLSAADSHRQKFGFKLETELQQPYEQALARVKDCLEAASFESAWQAGQGLDMRQTMELARESNVL